MILLLIAALVLQIVDGVTTYIGLGRNNVREVNGLAAWLMRKIGLIPAIIVLKGVAAVGAVAVYLTGYIAVLGALVGLYVLVAANNVRVLVRG